MVQESKAKQARPDPAQATYIGICTGPLQRGERDDLEGVSATAVGGQHGEEVDDLLGQPEQHDRPQCDGVPPPELVQLLAAPGTRSGDCFITGAPAGSERHGVIGSAVPPGAAWRRRCARATALLLVPSSILIGPGYLRMHLVWSLGVRGPSIRYAKYRVPGTVFEVAIRRRVLGKQQQLTMPHPDMFPMLPLQLCLVRMLTAELAHKRTRSPYKACPEVPASLH